MPMPSAAAKICGICGTDCSTKERIKDAKGRYFCKSCYEGAMRRNRAAEARNVEDKPIGLDAGPLGLEEYDSAKRLDALLAATPTAAPPAGHSACPHCRMSLTGAEVECPRCGRELPHLASERMRGWLWPVYVFFRPRFFFANFVATPVPLLTAIFAWLYGMAGVIDRLDSRQATSSLAGRSGSSLPDNWLAHWAFIALGGLVAGALYAGIGGWWYRVRLKWSGALSPPVPLVRRVYLYASMVYALPVIAVKLVETAAYDKPTEAVASTNLLGGLIVIICLFWSTWISYVGARTVFAEMRRGVAMLWFLILPAAFYLLIVVGLALVVFLMTFGPAQVSMPQHHRGSNFSFDYPGNWWIDTSDVDYDPDHDVFVEPIQDAYLHIMRFESTASPEEELQATVQMLDGILQGQREGAAFMRWGIYNGAGRTFHGAVDGLPTTVRIFAARVRPGLLFEVHEHTADRDRDAVEPGFEQVRRSFRAR